MGQFIGGVPTVAVGGGGNDFNVTRERHVMRGRHRLVLWRVVRGLVRLVAARLPVYVVHIGEGVPRRRPQIGYETTQKCKRKGV